MKVFKFLIIPISFVVWILILGISGYYSGFAFVIAFIAHSAYFIFVCCFLIKNTMLRVWIMTIVIGCSLIAGASLEEYILGKKADSISIDGKGLFPPYDKQTDEQRMYNDRIAKYPNVMRLIWTFPYSLFISNIGVTLYEVIILINKRYKK